MASCIIWWHLCSPLPSWQVLTIWKCNCVSTRYHRGPYEWVWKQSFQYLIKTIRVSVIRHCFIPVVVVEVTSFPSLPAGFALAEVKLSVQDMKYYHICGMKLSPSVSINIRFFWATKIALRASAALICPAMFAMLKRFSFNNLKILIDAKGLKKSCWWRIYHG